MRRRLLIGIAVCLLGPGAARGQLTVGGYAKSLAIRSQSFFTRAPFFLDLNRFRLQGRVAGRRLQAEAWLDTEVLAGSFLDTPDEALALALPRTTRLDLDWTLVRRGRLLARQRLFRAFVTLDAGRALVTVGRQRVAWGTGFVWTPTDLLNPVSPTAVERDEKGGVDALYVDLSLGALSRLEAVAALGPPGGRGSAAVRATGHLGETDVAVMAGAFRGDRVVGGDFATYVGDAGVRGEAALTRTRDGRTYARAVLNADYNFPGGYYGFVELHHNGAGTRDRHRYDTAALVSGTLFNVAREYGAVSLTRALSPLVSGSVYALFNLNDGSGLAGPALTWSVAQNLELFAAAYVFYGAKDSEFGALENVYFGALQWYF